MSDATTTTPTPRRCAVHPCRTDCHDGFFTCDEPDHRAREPELASALAVFIREQNAEDDAKIAESQAVEEYRAKNGVAARARQIAEERQQLRAQVEAVMAEEAGQKP